MANFGGLLKSLIGFLGSNHFLSTNGFQSSVIAANLRSVVAILSDNLEIWWAAKNAEKRLNKRRSVLRSKGRFLEQKQFRTLFSKALGTINSCSPNNNKRTMKNKRLCSGSLILIFGFTQTFQHTGDYVEMVIFTNKPNNNQTFFFSGFFLSKKVIDKSIKFLDSEQNPLNICRKTNDGRFEVSMKALKKVKYAYFVPSVRQKALHLKSSQQLRRPLPFPKLSLDSLKKYLEFVRPRETNTGSLFLNKSNEAANNDVLQRIINTTTQQYLGKKFNLRTLRYNQSHLCRSLVRSSKPVGEVQIQQDRLNYLFGHTAGELICLYIYDCS
jgi:hypothetical protein